MSGNAFVVYSRSAATSASDKLHAVACGVDAKSASRLLFPVRLASRVTLDEPSLLFTVSGHAFSHST